MEAFVALLVASATAQPVVELCPDGSEGLTIAEYEDGNAATKTCVPQNAFDGYAGDVMLAGTDCAALTSIEANAFKDATGTITINCILEKLVYINFKAFYKATNPNSVVDLTSATRLKFTGGSSFKYFGGRITMNGEYPDLRGFDHRSFYGATNTASSITLTNVLRLSLIGDKAFQNFAGTIEMEGTFDSLAEIGDSAFKNGGTASSDINIGCVSRVTFHLGLDAFAGFKGSYSDISMAPTCETWPVGFCPDGSGGLTIAEYEAGNAATKTCVPQYAFRKYAGGVTLKDTDCTELKSFEEAAFYSFSGIITIECALEKLEHVGVGAFNRKYSTVPTGDSSSVDLTSATKLKIISLNAFESFKGATITMDGTYPALTFIGDRAFHSTGSDLIVNLAGALRLSIIGYDAFQSNEGDRITMTGRYPALNFIGDDAFRTMGDAESNITIECSSAGLSFGTDVFTDFGGTHTDLSTVSACVLDTNPELLAMIDDCLGEYPVSGDCTDGPYGPIDGWLVGGITDFSNAFEDRSNFNGDLSKWNTGGALTMKDAFKNAENFNQYLGGWNIGIDTSLSGIFQGATIMNDRYNCLDDGPLSSCSWCVLDTKVMLRAMVVECLAEDSTHGDCLEGRCGSIDGWDTSKVTNMETIFYNAASFDGNITKWDTSKVTNMGAMFWAATSFDGDISGWDTSNVENMAGMFANASSFNRDIGGWDTSNVETMVGMFSGATSFDRVIRKWNTGNVETMESMFSDATSFDRIIGGWDTSNVTTMAGMFSGASSFNRVIRKWDTSNVKDMSGMFHAATSFNRDIEKWNTSNVEVMAGMFHAATSFDGDIGGWDTSNVEVMAAMFSGATSFNRYIGAWDTSNVETMEAMFGIALSFNRNIGGWDTSNVETMEAMFYGATKFDGSIDGWDTGNVEDMGGMFLGATSFNRDIGGWNTGNVESMGAMFWGATSFNRDIRGWNEGSLTPGVEEKMFNGATLMRTNYGCPDDGPPSRCTGAVDWARDPDEERDDTDVVRQCDPGTPGCFALHIFNTISCTGEQAGEASTALGDGKCRNIGQNVEEPIWLQTSCNYDGTVTFKWCRKQDCSKCTEVTVLATLAGSCWKDPDPGEDETKSVLIKGTCPSQTTALRPRPVGGATAGGVVVGVVALSAIVYAIAVSVSPDEPVVEYAYLSTVPTVL